MKICHLVSKPDSLTYTVAKALSYQGHSVQVLVSDARFADGPINGIRQRLIDTPAVHVAATNGRRPAGDYDRLIIQVRPRLLEHSQSLDALADEAPHITLISAGDRSQPWRASLWSQWREITRMRRWLGRIDRVVYKDGFYPADFYRLAKRRDVIGFDVHSQFLHEEHAYRAIHASDWDADVPRPILVNFLGSSDPEIRSAVLDSVRSFFLARGASGNTEGHETRPCFWHEYPDAKPVGLAPMKFLEVLSTSDFTLCPPGYSLVTHRPMEALLRGSIPVLHADELDLYDIGLADGVNCIAVARDQWRATLDRLGAFELAELVAMRRNIHGMLERLVHYEGASRRMCARLGVAQ